MGVNPKTKRTGRSYERINANKVYLGDCLEAMTGFPENSIDTIITDPPYGLKFMSKNWDRGIPGVRFWEEMLRVAKPGATLMAFGGARTHHRLMVAIEDAGWEIRDCINHFHSGDEREMALLDSMNEDQVQAYLELHYPNEMLSWVYGSGFPKAKRISESANHLVLKIDSCQCDENKCSIENTYPLQGVLDRICKAGILEPMEHDVYSNEYYGMNISQDFQGDYHSLSHSCDEFLRQVVDRVLAFLQPQEYVQEHNHSFGHEDDQASLSLHTLCRVLYNDLRANRDYFHPLKIENVLQSLQEYEDENIPLSDLHALLSKLAGSLNVLRLMDDDKEVHRNIHICSLVFCLPLSVLYILNSRKYTTIIPQIVFCSNCGKLRNIWDGWTSPGLKPAWEPIICAQKPIEGTYAGNAEKWGVAGLNVDDARISHNDLQKSAIRNAPRYSGRVMANGKRGGIQSDTASPSPKGRFPANLVISHSPGCVSRGVKRVKGHQGYQNGPRGGEYTSTAKIGGHHSQVFKDKPIAGHADLDGYETTEDWDCEPDCAVRLLDEGSGEIKSGDLTGQLRTKNKIYNTAGAIPLYYKGNKGGASRFFKNFPPARFIYSGKTGAKERGRYNNHATVKPIEIIEYLCILTKTPTGGIVLDPFAGSGTTALAAIKTGRPYILIEKEYENVQIINYRIANYKAETIDPPELVKGIEQMTLW